MNDDLFRHLQEKLAASVGREQLYKTIVNAPFAFKMETTYLSLGIIVLLVVDETDGLIHRVALSDTDMAAGTREVSVKRFEDIKVPLDYKHNIVAEAIRSQQPQQTADWAGLFAPALDPDEARLNQAGGAIACSFVYPLPGVDAGAALIFSYYQYRERMGEEHKAFMERYSGLVAEALRQQRA